MKSKFVLLLLWLISPLALSAIEYQCRECKTPILATDAFCPQCGTEADKCRIETSASEADTVQPPLPITSKTYLDESRNSALDSQSFSPADDVYLSLGPICAPYVGISIPYPKRHERLRGMSVALYNVYDGGASGIMLSAGMNGSSRCSLNGVGVSGLFNGGDALYGAFIAGVANYCHHDGTMAGVFAAGIFNLTEGECRGAQVGLFNLAGSLTGVQIGLVNYADRGDWCVQIGGFNILSQNAVKCLPLINGCF